MNRYDARQQFIEGLEQYIAGIETAEGLLRIARNASGYHDRLPLEASHLMKAVLESRNPFSGSYAAASQALHQRLSDQSDQAA